MKLLIAFPGRNACIRNAPNTTAWRRNISSSGTSARAERNGQEIRQKERESQKWERDGIKLSAQCSGSVKLAESKVFVQTSTLRLSQNVTAVVSLSLSLSLSLCRLFFLPFSFVTSFFQAFASFPSKVTRKSPPLERDVFLAPFSLSLFRARRLALSPLGCGLKYRRHQPRLNNSGPKF